MNGILYYLFFGRENARFAAILAAVEVAGYLYLLVNYHAVNVAATAGALQMAAGMAGLK